MKMPYEKRWILLKSMTKVKLSTHNTYYSIDINISFIIISKVKRRRVFSVRILYFFCRCHKMIPSVLLRLNDGKVVVVWHMQAQYQTQTK